MRRRPKSRAFIALGALLLPWTTPAVFALHLVHDHGASHDDLAAALHGHAHAEGTPDYDHVLTPPSIPAADHSRGVVATALRALLHGAEGDPLAPASLPRPAPNETASPPVSPPGPVLRI
jgi:hypothetical protein